MHRHIFVNLPVKDLQRSMKFFEAQGYSFNPDFTDDKAACLVSVENLLALSLVARFSVQFSKRPTRSQFARFERWRSGEEKLS